jgi:hypothetical protein
VIPSIIESFICKIKDSAHGKSEDENKENEINI